MYPALLPQAEKAPIVEGRPRYWRWTPWMGHYMRGIWSLFAERP